MKDILVVNDVHLGTTRGAGTTPVTATALSDFLFTEFERIINEHPEKDILVNGDLFDHFSVPEAVIERTFQILVQWMKTTGNRIHLGAGNHDFSARGDKLSSFHLLARILKESFPDQINVFESKLTWLDQDNYIIQHCLNQDLFDIELEKAIALPPQDGRKLFLHANFANPFAEHADHSLNVSVEQAVALKAAGFQLIFGHEHQARCMNLGTGGFNTLSKFDPESDVIVLGNQTPSSIADCLAHGAAQKDGRKYAHVIKQDGSISRVETWNNAGNFIIVDHGDLAMVTDQKFVRVSGEVSQALHADVVDRIAKFRSKSNAFIVTNSVKVEGISSMDDDDFTIDDLKAFDVREEFFALFTPEEQAVLKEIMESE